MSTECRAATAGITDQQYVDGYRDEWFCLTHGCWNTIPECACVDDTDYDDPPEVW